MRSANPRRPMLGLVFCAMLGTWLGLHVHVSAGWLVSVSIATVLVLVCLGFAASRMQLGPKGAPRFFLLLLSVLTYGLVALLAWIRSELYLGVQERAEVLLSNMASNRVGVIGICAGDVKTDDRRRADMFLLKTVATSHAGMETACPGGRLKVIWYGRRSECHPAYGERWKLEGHLSRLSYAPQKRSKAGRRPRDTSYVMVVRGDQGERLSEARGWYGVTQRCLAARHGAARLLSVGIEQHSEAIGLLHALLLGYRGELTDQNREVFAGTGTLHIFAISGLHVGIITFFITMALRWSRVSREHWILFLAPALIAYTLATGARASAVRACIMATVYFLAPLLGRKADVFSSLGLAAVIILAAVPTQLMDAGFIFSFVVVTGLIILYPHFERPLRRFWEPDPFVPPPKEVEKRSLKDSLMLKLVKLRTGTVKKTCSLAALSVAAWLASAPLTAYFFGRFSPIALLSNMVVIPLALLIVLTGCLSLVLGLCVEILANLLNHANLGFIHALVWVMECLYRVPGGTMKGINLPLWGVVAWYAVLLLGVFWWRQRERLSSSLTPDT